VEGGSFIKKWDLYDTFLMNIAAMQVKEINKYDNWCSICTNAHLNAVEITCSLSDDLYAFEKPNVAMYDTCCI
jgi:hypothetical protein